MESPMLKVPKNVLTLGLSAADIEVIEEMLGSVDGLVDIHGLEEELGPINGSVCSFSPDIKNDVSLTIDSSSLSVPNT